jgi:hypothetical protein
MNFQNNTERESISVQFIGLLQKPYWYKAYTTFCWVVLTKASLPFTK